MPIKNFNEKREKVLELDKRRTVFEIVRKNEGCHFREIERRSGLAHGTLKYHLGFLVRHGLVMEKKDGKNVRYFSEEISGGDVEIISLLRQKGTRQIVLYLAENKYGTHGELVDFVKLSPATISWHLGKLIDRKVVKRELIGKRISYRLDYPRDKLVKTLITFKESFFDSLVDRVVEMWEV